MTLSRFFKGVFALILLSGCTTNGTGVVATIAKFNEFSDDITVGGSQKSIAEAMEHHGVHGVTVIGIDGGAIVGFEFHGVEDFITSSVTDQDSVYQAASLSKFVVGLAMAEADRRALISLDKTLPVHVSENIGETISGWYTREFVNATGRRWAESVTMRRLLQNTAGMDRPTTGTACAAEDTAQKVFLGTFTRPCTKCVRCDYQPGTDWAYSSGGFVVAEAMFEEQSGRSARNFLNKDILEPYGLVKSTFKNAGTGIENLATGCDTAIVGSVLCQCEHEIAKVKFPGGMLANPIEYAKLMILVMNDGADYQGSQIIPLGNIRDAILPSYHKNSSLENCSVTSDCTSDETCIAGQCMNPLGRGSDWYGMGVHMRPILASDGYPRELFHTGGQPGFSSYVNIDRVDKDGIVIFINGSPVSGSSGRSALLDDIIAAFKRHYR